MGIPCLWRPVFCLWMNQGFLQRHLPSPIKWVRGELKSPHSKFYLTDWYRLLRITVRRGWVRCVIRELIRREHPCSQQLRHVNANLALAPKG